MNARMLNDWHRIVQLMFQLGVEGTTPEDQIKSVRSKLDHSIAIDLTSLYSAISNPHSAGNRNGTDIDWNSIADRTIRQLEHFVDTNCAMNQTALTKIRTPEDHWLAIRKNWTPIENLLKQLEGTGEKDDSSHQQIVSLKAKERIDRNLSNLLHEIKNQRNSVVHEDIPLPDKDAWVRNSEHAFQQLLRLLRPTEAPAHNHLTEDDTQVALTTPASAGHSTLEPAKSFQLHDEAPQITPRDLQICLVVHFVAAQLLWPLVQIASYLNRHQTTAVSPIISDLSRGFTWAVHQFQSVAHITFPAPAMLFVLSLALLLLNVSQRMRLWINAYKVFMAILGSQLILSYANKWIT